MRGTAPRGSFSLLGKVEGAEKAFLAGRRNREADLESAVGFFLEFLRGFESFDFDGPCVTVFGSARFADGHPYYRLARDLGAALAKAGYAVMTGAVRESWRPRIAASGRRGRPRPRLPPPARPARRRKTEASVRTALEVSGIGPSKRPSPSWQEDAEWLNILCHPPFSLPQSRETRDGLCSGAEARPVGGATADTAHAIRASLLASATVATFGCVRAWSRMSQASNPWRSRVTCRATECARGSRSTTRARTASRPPRTSS